MYIGPWIGKHVHAWWVREMPCVSKPAAQQTVVQNDPDARPLLYDAGGRPLQRERIVIGFAPRKTR